MIIDKVFYDLCSNVGSPVSLGLWLKFRYAPNELARTTIDPLDYDDPVSFGVDYACVSYLRKWVGLNTGIDTKEEALLKFRKSEEKCSQSNVILRKVAATGQLDRTDSMVLHRAQELMQLIWGRPSFDDLFSRCGWGPGATASLKGGSASREHKMSQFPVSLTPTAMPYFRAVIREDHLWLDHLLNQDLALERAHVEKRLSGYNVEVSDEISDDGGGKNPPVERKVWGPTSLLNNAFEFTNSSRLLTVPKDARSDRTICAEPTGNIFLQKGIGGYLRSRLRRFGIDLDDQTINQGLAKLAYSQGLSTLDLSAASDTVSIGVVKLLCPSDMFGLLDRLRSPSYGTADGEVRFHKFSSMGNGFTFELESAIFYCLVRAVAEIRESDKPIGVYGDDIICGREIAREVVTVLEDCGFSLNMEKSYFDGNFFESCGKHFFKEQDITPPYQKRIVSDDDCLEYIRMSNRLFEWKQRMEVFCHPTVDRIGRVCTGIIRRRPKALMGINCFGYSWFTGDGFFKVVRPLGIRYCASNGYKLTFLKAAGPKQIVADGGLFASMMRQKADRPSSGALVDIDSDPPTKGMCDIRPGGLVKQYRVRTRWVPAHFGETDLLGRG